MHHTPITAKRSAPNMRFQKAGYDGQIAGTKHEPTRHKGERLGEHQCFGFQKAVELAGIADGRTGHAGFHPAADLASKPVAQHRLHAALADACQRRP